MKEEKDCPASWTEERDLMEVYPPRKMECSEADLGMAICILEGVLEKPELMENTIKAHLSIPEVRDMYIKTFMLAAESMKGNLKPSEGLKVSQEKIIRFY